MKVLWRWRQSGLKINWSWFKENFGQECPINGFLWTHFYLSIKHIFWKKHKSIKARGPRRSSPHLFNFCFRVFQGDPTRRQGKKENWVCHFQWSWNKIPTLKVFWDLIFFKPHYAFAFPNIFCLQNKDWGSWNFKPPSHSRSLHKFFNFKNFKYRKHEQDVWDPKEDIFSWRPCTNSLN